MTKKDLFRIILKIAGLYFIVVVLFQTLPAFFIFFNTSGPELWQSIALLSIILLLLTIIFVTLIFKPDGFINALKLDKGFDDDKVSFRRVDFSDLLKIAIFAIGLSLIVRHLPIFITHVFFLFKLLMKNQNDFTSQFHSEILTDYVSWAVKIISLIIGYLMITNYASIANYLIKKEPKEQE